MNKKNIYIFLACAALYFGMNIKSVFAADNCRCSKATNNISFAFRDLQTFNVATKEECNNKCYENGNGEGMFNFGSDTVFEAVHAPLGNDTNWEQKPGQASSGAIQNYKIPGQSVSPNTGLVKCGRPGQNMCTLCDLIAGLNWIIQYIMKIAIGVGLAAFTISGIMYAVSAGDKGMIDNAKGWMKNAAKGFVFIFGAWVMINTLLMVIGAKNSLGINVTGWGNFDCNSTAAQRVE